MRIRSCLRGIALWVAALTLILSPMLVYADCVIVGTIDGGYIVSCTGTDTDGFCIGAGNDIITVELDTEDPTIVSNTIQQFLETVASANAIAIDAGDGNNQVTNYGSVGATADANALPEDGSASHATATATAIKTGDNRDIIQNFSTMTSAATSNSESGAISMVADLSDLFHSATSEATAKGIDAGGDEDQIVNTGTINAAAEASADLTDILLPPLGSKTLGLPPRATAHSTGIEGGAGNDGITNSGTVYATAITTSESLDISLTLDLEGGATSEATAMGINANEGDDQIINTASINAEAEATARSDAVVLNLLSIGTYATPTTATASSTGIVGGAGKDEITNSGVITAKATSSAEALSVTMSALQYEVASDGDARTESVASATGIAGGDGDDRVTNMGTVTATASATASTTDISVEYTGAARGNSSTISDAFATGIDGGVGKDDISNSSAITVNATSEVDSLSIEAKRNEIPLDPLEWVGADLDDARTAAQATAIGIDGGDGDDTITNSGTIAVSSKANASSDNIAAEVSIPLESGSNTPKASESSISLEAPIALGATGIIALEAVEAQKNNQGGNAIANAGTIAQVTATGIAGGAGNDTITNNNKVSVKGEAEADSLSIGVTISYERSEYLDILGLISIADTTTTAQAAAAGVDGGAGDDTITNTNELGVEANSNATSAAIKAHLQGDFKKDEDGGFEYEIGASLVECGTESTAMATGIAGGDGNDSIINSGKVIAKAVSDADSTSVATTLVGAGEGLVVGFIYADATTTAQATATGIDGGAGNNFLNSIGEIEVTAESTSTSTSVGVTVTGVTKDKGIAASVALTDGTTKAISSAAGMKGADGADTVTSSGKIKTLATSDADSASISASIAGTKEGLAVGVTYADATTTAEANAVGIDGGSGNDTLTNTSTGQIEVTADPTSSSASVSATITGVTKGTGIVGGAALTDGTTKAIGNATGISGGEGDDTIINSGKMIVKASPDADSASVSVNLGAALGELGLVGGFSYADATTTAQASAIGIDGGLGNDTINNTGEIEVTTEPTASSASIGLTAQGVKGMGAAVGISLTDGTTKAISNATGIRGGDGMDTMTNSNQITVTSFSDADSASVSVSLSAAKEGVAAGGTFADTTTTAQATATGICGGEGKDTITNSGTIEVTADAEGSSASVSFSAQGTMTGATLGIALTDGTTKAISTATGITGGGGDDTITNSYITNVISTADVAAASVSVNAGVAVDGAAVGAALADGKTVATSSAIGLEGGAGNDTLTNRGSTTVSATSGVTAASVAVSLEGTRAGLAAGISLVDGENRADALAIGITGGSGDDTIRNENGTTSVDATTTSVRTNVSVTGTFSLYGAALGASAADATNIAAADARGIEGGEGNEKITNASNLVMGATTSADTTSVSVSANVAIFGAGPGASLANAETTGSALATGIEGGEGDNTIMNTSTGSINATATAHADTVSVSVNLIGAVKASADSTATATSTGMRGGSGTDFIQNDGSVTLSATSDADASSYAVQLVGYGESNAKGISNSVVKGIDGGDGVNTITNSSSATITGTATALADANSYDIQLSGGGKATAGTVATATAIGIAGGKDMDTIRNEGTINLTAGSTLVSESRSYKIFGVGLADADSKAETIATGIDGGEGPNTIANVSTGSITVSSNASATATSLTVNIGVAGATASTTSKAHSTGIKSGGSEDTIINEGILSVNATSSTYAGSGDFSLVGLSFGDALTEAITEGIVAGDGKNVILNTGSITVGSVQDNNHPMAYSNVDSVSFSLFNISSASFGSKAQAIGIVSGSGDDTIINQGMITVGDDDWMAKGRAYGFSGNFFEFFSLTSVGSTAETVSTGVEGRDGNDNILNDSNGVLNVKATSYARTEGAADTTTFGSPAAFASSTTKSTATGISGGEGNDVIENKGVIDVYAHTLADAYSDSWVGWGSPRADSTGNATATAVGISTEEGQNFVANSGIIDVKALAETIPYANADSDVATTEAEATSYSKSTAFGIKAGEGDDVIQNRGNISVEAVAEKATSNDQRTTAWTDEVAKVGTSKNNPGIRSSAASTGISAGGGKNQITNDGTIDVKATATGEGYAFAESDAYDTETTIWAVADATATGIATGTGSSQITNNGPVKVSAGATSQIYSDSDSVDDADATGGATVSAKALGINASGSNTLVINADTVDVDASAIAEGNSRADSAGDGYGTAIFEPNSNADAVGIGVGDGNTVWNQDQAQMTVDAKAIINVKANGDEFGTMGSSKENPGAKAAAKATGISMGEGDNQIFNDGLVSVNAEGNINVGTRSLSTTRSTHTSTWARADSTATGFSTGKGNTSITNTGGLEVDAEAIAYLNDPNSGWGTYWRSDSWYNADAKTGAYAYSNATGIEASANNSDNPCNTVLTNSGAMNVTSTATAKGNAAGDRGGTSDGTATTYAEASAEASGFFVGNGNKLVSIENSGKLEVKSTAETLAFSHGDTDSWSYAKSFGYAYGIKVGDNNELVSIKNSGTMKVESTALSDTADDEPWRQSDASSNVYGIDIGNSNSEITNSGVLDIRSKATATLYTDEDTAVSTVSSAYATGIGTGNGTNTISNDSQIQVIASAESNPSGGNSNSTNIATAQASGIKTGSSSDTIALGTGSLINTAANASTFSYNGATNASAIGIDAGDGANQITNHGFVNIDANATAEVKTEEIFMWSITYPATAVSNVTGIKSGQGADILNNYGEIMVNSKAGAVINQVLDWSAGTKTATANATGIDAGNGDNFIANYGTIDVSALAAAGTGASPRVRTDGVESTTAIGIATGDGNDTIINSGSITTRNQRLEYSGSWIHITSQPGIAITSGGGSDQVFLMDGSETNGHIDLGGGDDWLTFVGTPLVTGDVTGAAGTDTLVFVGAGSIDFTPVTFENAVKQGAGTYSVASLPTMQRIEVNQGTLQINSNYAMADDSTFQTNVNGDGSHGQLKVNGTAQLAGDLKVIKGPGPYANGTTYDIIGADTLNGSFSNLMLPAPTPLVSFEMNQLPNSVEIETSAKNFTTVAKNRVHWVIANYLDRIMPLANDDLSEVLGEIQSLSEPGEFNTAFSTLSPMSYDNYTRGTLFTIQQYNKSLQYRMNNVRYHFMAGSPDNEKPILLAYNGSDASLGQLFTPGEFPQIQGKSGLWLDAFGQWGDQDEEDGFAGYDYFMRGATVGFDHRLMDKLMAGLSLGYSRSDIDLDGDQGRGYVRSLFGSLYGSYFNKNLYVDAIFSYGWNWYDNSRLITIGGIFRRATSEHDGHLFSAYLGGGYYFDFKPWALGPYSSLQYIYLDEDSFKERGAGGISLRVDDRQTDALVSELGLRMLVRLFKGKHGYFLPEVSLAWSHDFDIDDHVVRASFAGSPGASFSIEGQDVERNGVALGAGITFIHKSGISTSFRYKGDFRGDYKSNAIMGELRYSF